MNAEPVAFVADGAFFRPVTQRVVSRMEPGRIHENRGDAPVIWL